VLLVVFHLLVESLLKESTHYWPLALVIHPVPHLFWLEFALTVVLTSQETGWSV
jgi:hypothetical protein